MKRQSKKPTKELRESRTARTVGGTKHVAVPTTSGARKESTARKNTKPNTQSKGATAESTSSNSRRPKPPSTKSNSKPKPQSKSTKSTKSKVRKELTAAPAKQKRANPGQPKATASPSTKKPKQQLGNSLRGNYTIECADRQSVLSVPLSYIRRVVTTTLKNESITIADISIALVTDQEIHGINREFLDHDFPTDVISFSLDEEPVITDMIPSERTVKSAQRNRGATKTINGELVVSTETAISQADAYGWTALSELTLYIVHGLLHLCGYDDRSARDRAVMRKRETEVLELLSISRSGVDRQ